MGNPNPSRVTDAQWRLWEELKRLEPETELGGFYANKSGYHSTRADNDRFWPGNYSVRDAVDRRGPADKTAGLDWTFPSAQRGDYTLISKYCRRLMASSVDLDDERLNGWREWYGQTDNDTAVEGWDCRYLEAVTSDSSHLWHIHFSETRELVGDWANKDALLSVLRGEPLQAWRTRTNNPEVDVNLDDKVGSKAYPNRTVRNILDDLEAVRDLLVGDTAGTQAANISANSPVGQLLAMAKTFPSVAAQVAAIRTGVDRDDADEAAIAAAVLAGMDYRKFADAVVDALPTEQAQQFVDALVARLDNA